MEDYRADLLGIRKRDELDRRLIFIIWLNQVFNETEARAE